MWKPRQRTSSNRSTAILGKPAGPDEAQRMLRRLRGRRHQVHTALAVARFAGGRRRLLRGRVNSSTVTMRGYSDAEIGAYVATGDPLDKAGAYAIQHPVFRRWRGWMAAPPA